MVKRHSKRLLALLLTLIMVIGLVPASASALEAGDPNTLTEKYINEGTGKEIAEPQTSKATEAKTPQAVKGYVYANSYTENTEHIYSRDDLTYLYGYPDKTVRGERYLSRAEAAAIFYRLYDGYYPKLTQSMTKDTFSDVNTDAWYYTEVETLYNIGIISGYEDGTFKPDAPVSRGEFAKLAVAWGDLPRTDKVVFSDVTNEHWSYQFVGAAYAAGWLKGYDDGTYKPDQDISRAETVTMVNQVINRAITLEKLKELGVENPYSDLVETYWAYADLICATVKHTAADWHDITYNNGNLNIIIERFVDENGDEIAEKVTSQGKENTAPKPFEKYTYNGYITTITYTYRKGAAEMSVTKSADKATAKVGDKVVYTVEVSNSENATDSLENVVLNDTIPEYVDFSHGSVQMDSKTAAYTYDDANRNLLVELGDIEPDKTVKVTFECQINDKAYDKTFYNTVVASADNEQDKPATDDGITVNEGTADMAVTKSVDQNVAKVGDTLVYTVEVSNSKHSTVNVKNAVMSDTLSEYVTFSHGSVQVDGYTFNYRYDNAGKNLSVELGDIAPGQTKVITFEVTVNSTAYGQTFNNTAIASADNEDDKSGTDDGVTVDDGTAEGSVGAKTVSSPTAKVGDTLTYTIELRNSSTATADWQNVKVTDVIPEYLSFIAGSVEADGRATTNYAYDAGSKTLTLFGDDIAIGQSKKFTFKVTVEDGAQGLYIVNTAVVSSDGRNDIQLPDTGVQIDGGDTDPMITKTASVKEAYEGDIFKYTVKLKNGTTASAAWKNVTLTDVIPDGLKLVAGTVTLNGRTVSYGIAGQAIEVTIGDLKPNEEAIVEFEVRVLSSAVGTTVTNVAVGKGDNGDKTGTDDGVTIIEPQNPGDNGNGKDTVTGSKTVDKTIVSAGDKVTFTITAKNNTTDDWTSVHVYDVLDTSMITLIDDTIYVDGIRYPETSGKWIYSDKQLVYNLGDIAPGQEVICKFTVQFKNDAAGQTYTNNATLKGNNQPNVYVKAPEILVLGGGTPGETPDSGSDIHYKLFGGHGDANGNPLFIWTPNDNIKMVDMCRVGYRLMTDYYRDTTGNGTITVPNGVTDREAQYFISHGIISAAEYTAGADATQSQIYRILNAALKTNLQSTSTTGMSRASVAKLICELTKRDDTPNTNGLTVAYFSDKGSYIALIDEVSNSHDYTLDSNGNETWTAILSD